MPKALDFIRMVQRGEAAPPPIADLIGFTLTEVEPGRAVIAFDAGPRHANPMGTLHGGVLCDIADAAMGMAYAASLDEGETFLKGGHTVGLVECDVVDDKDRLFARASSTCMTLRGEPAVGR